MAAAPTCLGDDRWARATQPAKVRLSPAKVRLSPAKVRLASLRHDDFRGIQEIRRAGAAWWLRPGKLASAGQVGATSQSGPSNRSMAPL
jgi:hypothetical protein